MNLRGNAHLLWSFHGACFKRFRGQVGIWQHPCSENLLKFPGHPAQPQAQAEIEVRIM